MITFAEAMGAIAPVVALVGFLALVNERVMELLLRPLCAALPVLENYKMYLTVASGVGIAFLFGVDAFSPMTELMGFQLNWSGGGVLLTGLVLGGGSNLVHDLWPQS